MSLRNDLAAVIARDPRYAFDAYAFVFESLEYAKTLKKKRSPGRVRGARSRASAATRHVTGRELCEAARRLAIDTYGFMALTVLAQWGLHSTSDIGEIVYGLIASGDFEKTDDDQRSDFDDVYDFEDAFRRDFVVDLGEPA